MMRTRPGARIPPNLDYDRTNMGSGRARGSSRRVKERAVRYGTEHKQATRRRIIETAGRRLKRDGIDGSGVATLMADAGLTNGAFYAHFDSKEDLVASTVADQLREQRERYSGQSLEEIVRGYLSIQHRDNTEGGCPSAALLDEIARSSR